MAAISTPAIILASLRYGETSKIVRLATRDHGVQSAIAKGASRPKSRFGAALQLLSEGQAQVLLSRRSDLHILTAFDLTHLRIDLAANLDRYSAASVLAEVVLRFAPADPHPASFDLLRDSLSILEVAPTEVLDALGLRMLWQLVSVLGFAPSLETCVRDGTPVAPSGALAFSAGEGGALCEQCASLPGAQRLEAEDRADLAALVNSARELPLLDQRHATAHRRLLARYIRHHLAEGAELPALEFWSTRPWVTP